MIAFFNFWIVFCSVALASSAVSLFSKNKAAGSEERSSSRHALEKCPSLNRVGSLSNNSCVGSVFVKVSNGFVDKGFFSALKHQKLATLFCGICFPTISKLSILTFAFGNYTCISPVPLFLNDGSGQNSVQFTSCPLIFSKSL